MQLILFCKEADIKQAGANAVLDCLVKDLKILEADGVSLGNEWGTQKGSEVFIHGNNLGSHMIGGDVENLSSVTHC